MGFSIYSRKKYVAMKKNDVTYNDKINELKLDFRNYNTSKYNFILVEGDSDIKVYRAFFKEKTCKVECIPGGCLKLENAIQKLINDYKLIIGIRDSDFIQLSDDEYKKTNMILTDYHDIEMTMLANETVIGAMLNEYTDLPKKEHTQFLNNLCNTIEEVSYFKWLNSLSSSPVTQSQPTKSGFQDLISFDKSNVNFDEYLKRVYKNKKRPNIYNGIEKLKAKKPNIYQLTNGHDLIKTICTYFNKRGSGKGLSYNTLESIVRIAYTFELFKKTKMFCKLKKWEEDNSTSLFAT